MDISEPGWTVGTFLRKGRAEKLVSYPFYIISLILAMEVRDQLIPSL